MPRVLYHGSPHKFDQFNLDFAGRVDQGYYGPGVYLTPSFESANDYGLFVYQVQILNPKPFFLFDAGGSTAEETNKARLDLAQLYPELAPNTKVAPKYRLERIDRIDNYGEREIGWAVHPTPEIWHDVDAIYGQTQPTKELAIISHNDELEFGYKAGPSCQWGAIPLLKSIGRDRFPKVVKAHGFNCVAIYGDTVSEVMVPDPKDLKIVGVRRSENKYGVYH